MAYSVVAQNVLDKVVLQDLDASSSSQLHDLGYTVKATTGQEYTYAVTNASTLAASAGYPAYFFVSATSPWSVTSDYSDSAIDGNGLAGVFTCAVTAAAAAHYVWIQTKGIAPDASVSTGVAACDELVAVADYLFDTQITGESSYAVRAIALEADTTAAADILLL